VPYSCRAMGEHSVSLDAGTALPLAVDLDGTLLKSDSLYETLLDLLRDGPSGLWRVPLNLLRGRAALKAFLAQRGGLDVSHWPVRREVLDYAQAAADAGRRVVLATAADERVAKAVVDRFPFFSGYVASDASRNLKGDEKAARLKALFPEGFIYAGDAAADLPVWRASRGCILVGVSGGVARRVDRLGLPVQRFPARPTDFALWRRSLRLHQWIKNSLVFVPIVLGGMTGNPRAWLETAIGFLALCLAASSTYVLNDLWDLPSDRRHWSKRTRPLANGDLSIRTALLLSSAGLVAGLSLAAWDGAGALAVLLAYVALTLVYSFGLKRVPVLDVFVLACLLTIRLALGVVICDVRWSIWLLSFSMFIFFSLSMAKRHTEVLRIVEHNATEIGGRGYRSTDWPLTLGLGLSSMFASILILILYLTEEALRTGAYAEPVYLWPVPPVIFLFLSRVWLLSQRGKMHDDPVAFAITDRASVALGGIAVACIAAAIFGLRWL
jgi:4-hydroxybenzoate polyprenyltransferase